MRLYALFCFSLALLAFPSVARADTVVLKTGTVLQGRVVDQNDATVVLQIGETKLTIERDKIREVKVTDAAASGETPAVAVRSARAEYEARLQKLQADDAQAQFALGTWCRDQRLTEEALKHFKLAALCNPPHPNALDECARLGAFLIKGVAFGADVLLGPNPPEMKPKEQAELWERILAYGKLNDEQKISLIGRLSELYEKFERYDDIKRLWPPYADLMAARARAIDRFELNLVIKSIADRFPDGLYEVQPTAAGSYPATPFVTGTGGATVDIAAGKHALAAPAVLTVAVRDVAKKYIADAYAQIEQAKIITVTNPLKAYQENLKQAEKAVAYVKDVAPDVDKRLPMELASAQIGALSQVASVCGDEANRSKPDYCFYKHPMSEVRFHPKDQWFEWARKGLQAVRYYNDAIQAHQRILQAAEPFPNQFAQQIAESQRLMMDMDHERKLIRDKLSDLNRIWKIPGV